MIRLETILPRWILILAVVGLSVAGCTIVDANTGWPSGSEREPYSPVTFNFMVIGDWGREGSHLQRYVATRMGAEAARDESRFVISTGDNFYESGVQSVTDPLWERSFEDVYDAPSLQVPWYPVLGNHDYSGNVDAQLSYSLTSSRWRMPARYHAFETLIDDTTRALFVFIDTQPLTGHVYTDAEVFAAKDEPARQLHWLDSTLAASTAKWRIVVGHHPLYAADATHPDDEVMIPNLRPILERRHVNAYFSGHVHSLQHLHPEGTVDYFISGAGSHIREVDPGASTRYAVAVPGFLAVSLTITTLRVQFVGYNGDLFYDTAIE